MNEYLIFQLKQGRMNKGLKQSDVTKLTGIKNTTLSNYENGVTEPDIDTFLCLCELYELDFVSIMEEAYGISVPGRDFDIKPSEIDFLKMYRELNEHGKKMVNFTLLEEHKQSIQEKAKIDNDVKFKSTLNAAHARTDTKATASDQKHDDDIMNDENF